MPWVDKKPGKLPHFHVFPDPESQHWTSRDFPGEGSIWECHCGQRFEILYDSGLSEKVAVSLGHFFGMQIMARPIQKQAPPIPTTIYRGKQ